MAEVKKKLKCFWCSRKYVDLIGHTKRQHPGFIPRSYDLETVALQSYAMIPVHFDPAIVDTTRKVTPLMDLLPRAGDKKETTKSIPEQTISKFKAWINKARVKIAYWIGGQALEDDRYEDEYEY